MGDLAVRIDRCSDQAARKHPLVPLGDCHEACMGSPEAHWNAEALSRSYDYVHAEFTRWGHHTQGQEVSRHCHSDPGLAEVFHDLAQWPQVATGSGKGNERPEHVVVTVQSDRPGVGDTDLNAQWPGAGADHVYHLWVAVGVHEEGVAFAPVGPSQQRHCLGSGRCLVEKRRVGQVHSRQVGDHRLESQEDL